MGSLFKFLLWIISTTLKAVSQYSTNFLIMIQNAELLWVIILLCNYITIFVIKSNLTPYMPYNLKGVAKKWFIATIHIKKKTIHGYIILEFERFIELFVYDSKRNVR